jgi:dephospho-CoA kinase
MYGRDFGVVGLHGMGGIGKTTLAEAFYAEQYKLPTFKRRVMLHVGQDARDGELQRR